MILDYKLSRYACYLIAQNGDPNKTEIAFGQSTESDLHDMKYEIFRSMELEFDIWGGRLHQL